MYEELDVREISTFPPLAAIVTDQIAAAARIPQSATPPLCSSSERVQDSPNSAGAPMSKDNGHILAKLPVEILVLVVYESDWKTAAMWRRVARAFYSAVAVSLRRRYDELIRPYVTNVELFNRVIREHAAVISGSTALYFFMPDSGWHPNDLDIYVADGNWTSFLRTVQSPEGLNWSKTPPSQAAGSDDAVKTETDEGSDSLSSSRLPTIYDQLPPVVLDHESGSDTEYESDEDNVPGRSIDAARGLRSVRRFYTPNGRRVDVIRSPSNNAITPLRFFWSSAVMNFISPDACFCGFPRATLARRGALKIGLLKPRDKVAIAKYEARGYTFGGSEYREELDMWDYLFFGERVAMFFDFRLTPESPKAKIPLRLTGRGWVPAFNTTLPTPGQYAIIPLNPAFEPLTVPSNALWILTMPLREPAFRLRLRLT